ncbi:MAG: hypothetical protein IH840_17665 [Candidatus Heimdallarchaeota archaeon]|nr:hypothetical protein [Candidatus Heimdallarchaeota archaeon]
MVGSELSNITKTGETDLMTSNKKNLHFRRLIVKVDPQHKFYWIINNSNTSNRKRHLAKQFAKNCDEYPLHFVLHLMHAIEVVGYKHPNAKTRTLFYEAYTTIVSGFHLRPESPEDLDARMLEDRIATGNV